MTEENINSVQTESNEDNEDDMSLENKHKLFVSYFESLDRIGVPYGISELIKKAKELKMSTPSRKEIKSWKRKCV